MLGVIGVKELEDLFQTIPKEYRLSKPLNRISFATSRGSRFP
jgi:glycine cleavage system pyridoxal-binding protein P